MQVALGEMALTVLAARVVCKLIAVQVQLIPGVVGHSGSFEVSNGGCEGTLPPQGSVYV